MTSTERDTESRNRIISDIDVNFFVEAGAGSGKTTMLVNRMAAMVEAGIPISRICAITFTRAAAGEFYDRFQKLLIKRSNPDYIWEDNGQPGQLPAPTPESRAMCRAALENIDLCFMGTIDSFCSMILAEHPSEAGIPSDSAIISDQEEEDLYRQEYVKICEGEYGEDLKSLAATFRSLHSDAESAFLAGMTFLMEHRNVEFHFEEPELLDIDRDLAGERKEILDAVKCLVEHPELNYGKEKNNLEAWEHIEEMYRALRRRWSTNFTNVLYNLNRLANIRTLPMAAERYGSSLSHLFVPGGAKGQWLKMSEEGAGTVRKKFQTLQYNVSMSFLTRCIPYMEHALKDRGAMTFFDALYYLRNMLRRDAEEDGTLIRYIYNRHSCFLIDEFQDTNPMQAEVFFYLTSEKPVPQWTSCLPRPGSLFIVGDPKQSIYRFRSADVSSFLRVKKLFENNGGAILSLSKNYRSTKTLCGYYNRVFSSLLPKETENQSRFEEIPMPDETREGFQGIYTYKAFIGKSALEHPEETDPVLIAEMIRRIAGREDIQITTPDCKGRHPVRYRDIMVITASKAALKPIMAELDVAGIPSKVEGKVPFDDNEALQEVSRIYAVFSDPHDQSALYDALTGKLVGFSEEDLLRYKSIPVPFSLTAEPDLGDCKDEKVLRVADMIRKLRNMYRRALRLSPAGLFSMIMDEFQIYRTAEAKNLEVLYYSLELLRTAEKAGEVVTLRDGHAFIRDILGGLSGEERCLNLSGERDCVHMANLHKVKGLEAPVVILAAASPGFPSAENRIRHTDFGSEGYLFSLKKNQSNGYWFSTDAYGDAKEEEKAALQAEKERLIYVAATRARDLLIICNSVYTTAKGTEISKTMWKPLLESGIPEIFSKVDPFEGKIAVENGTASSASLYEQAAEESALRDKKAEKATFTVENPSRQRVSSKLSRQQDEAVLDDITLEQTIQIPETADPSFTEEEKPGMPTSTSEARSRFPALYGTMVHKLLEHLVSTRNHIVIVETVDEIIREYSTPQTKQYEKEIRTDLIRIAEKMRGGGYPQTNGLPQDILKTLLAADEVYCEVPFCYKEETDNNTILWNGIMDVVYYADGQWHIIDYKTNAEGQDLDNKYKVQLDAYIRAFHAITWMDADAKTYHLDV